MQISLDSIMIYARDMKTTAHFYCRFFNFKTSGEIVEGLMDLTPENGGASIVIHQAAKSVKLGQIGVKLTFSVPDIAKFIDSSAKAGLVFGPIHEANGYQFANTKDPDGNSVSISSRAFRSDRADPAH